MSKRFGRSPRAHVVYCFRVNSTRWDVVGIGANSIDFVNLLPSYPQQHGSFAKMRIRKQTISGGGQMATALTTCASLGLRAKYIGVTGTDENGRRVREEMATRAVDMMYTSPTSMRSRS